MKSVKIDLENNEVIVEENQSNSVYKIGTPEAFNIISQTWLRCGWDNKYVYTFSWMGRPIIQLPEDIVRTQEVIYKIEPDVIIETGIAHGGSLILYASLCKAIGRGKIIGIDIEIRPHNRVAIEEHNLFEYITLVEGSSVNTDIVSQVKSLIKPTDKVLIILDSNHSREHVLAELNAYAELVSLGSYIVATDGIMKDLVSAPRSQADWGTNNPYHAAQEFLATHPEFRLEQPKWEFNESNGLSENVTYWPGAWLQRIDR
ncbi:CmcI family methyltransferase [Chamaesiphon sp. OTE_20_metabat_361]|uniref:cephalosporin hydroxylase family protein n=1 Tax=Chamaesiphon sp. OTE_20_metabat_361 TaxID=2964689 RepID=UPI00286CB5E4|nr:CmcI family methyltransferase [Chamaesiphon sp. OTE_20_metabat_361]